MSARPQRVIGVPLGVHNVTGSTPEENTKYRVGGDPLILLDEVFNSSTRAVCVYGRVGNILLEDGTYVEGPDDMIEDCLDDGFTDEEMTALATVLPYNTSLLAVNINGVCVTDTSIVQMCRALKNTRVRLIDLTNTVIDDETGVALLELAQENIHLRTIVVDDTLIAETIMDEIDMACLNNEAMIPILPDPAPINQNRERYCVYNFFGVCTEGDQYCPFIHGAPPIPHRKEEDSELKEVTQQKKSLESVAAIAAHAQKQGGLLTSSAQLQLQQKQKQAQEREEARLKKEEEKRQQQEEKERLQKLAEEEEEKKKLQKKLEKKKKREAEETEKRNQMILKGVAVMSISGLVVWLLLKKLGENNN